MQYDRRRFLATAGLSLAGASLTAANAEAAMPAQSKDALERLMDGNARFVADKAVCPPLTSRRLELAESQQPFAIILSCSDSRVPVEIVFDQIPGNIFGIRIAGNFVDDEGLGSIEYSIAVLKSSMLLVLGHTHCGAVKAAVEYVKNGTQQPGHIQKLVTAIAPAARGTKGAPGDWVENAVERNVHDNVAALAARSSIVAGAVKAGTLAIAGGVYDLHSGKVSVVH